MAGLTTACANRSRLTVPAALFSIPPFSPPPPFHVARLGSIILHPPHHTEPKNTSQIPTTSPHLGRDEMATRELVSFLASCVDSAVEVAPFPGGLCIWLCTTGVQ